MHEADAADPRTAETDLDHRVGEQDLTRWSTPVGRAAARAATTTSSRLGAQRTLVLILAIGAGAAFVLAFAAARVYDAVTESDGIASVDAPILAAAKMLRSPGLDGFAAAVAYGFGPVGMPIIAVLACVAIAVRRRSITPVILTVAAGAGSLLMTIAGKDIVDRHRPPFADAIPPFEYSPSFPSGHTLNATVICGVLAYLLILRLQRRAARVAVATSAVLVAVVVGLTRVLLGAHWFTDVLAGWLLGAAWLAMVITAHRLYLTARRRREAPGSGRADAVRSGGAPDRRRGRPRRG